MVLAAPFVVLAAMGLLGRPRTARPCRRPPRPRPAARGPGHDVAARGRRPRRRRARHPGRRPGAARRHRARRTAPRGRWSHDGLPTARRSARGGGAAAPSGAERIALTSAWAGWRWGPVDLPEHGLQRAAADGDVRQPRGGAAARRPRRPAPVAPARQRHGVRGDPAFATGDRLKRINWPVSLRTGELHVITTRAEQDAGVWLVVDGLRDIGVSGGIDGAASTLDLTVRAAARSPSTTSAPATGWACSWSPPTAPACRSAPAPRHLHRLHGTLARVRTETRSVAPERLDLGAAAPAAWSTCSRRCSSRRWSPRPRACSAAARRSSSSTPWATRWRRPSGDRLALPDLAARMQKIERDDRLAHLAALGTPGRPVARTGHARHRPAPARAPRPGAEGACPMSAGLRLAGPGVTAPVVVLRALVVLLPCSHWRWPCPTSPHWFVLAGGAGERRGVGPHARPRRGHRPARRWSAAGGPSRGVVDWRVLVVGRAPARRPRGGDPAVVRPAARSPSTAAWSGCGRAARSSPWCRCRSPGWPCGGWTRGWRRPGCGCSPVVSRWSCCWPRPG